MDGAELVKQFEEAKNRAAGIAAVVVEAVEREQAGHKYLAGACPRCHTPMNLASEGKQLCRRCHLWMEFRRVK